MERRRSKEVAIADIVRRGSIVRATIGGGIAAGTDAAIDMTEMATGLRGSGGGQDPETASRTASTRTDIVRARARGNTEDIDRGVKNVDVTKTAIDDHETTTAITKERRVRGEKRGVDPTAVEADRDCHTSTQDHAKRGEKHKSSNHPEQHRYHHQLREF